MIKTDKNGRRMAAALISVLFWTFGSLGATGMVFCVAGPDHTGIEPSHYGLHTPPQSTGDHEPAFGSKRFRSAGSGSWALH